MNRHTHAPWRISGDLLVDVERDAVIAEVFQEEHLGLIAAAPVMLHALQQVDAFFTACGKHGEYAGRVHTHPLVKAAIAEAAVLSPKPKDPDPFDDFCYQCDQGD